MRNVVLMGVIFAAFSATAGVSHSITQSRNLCPRGSFFASTQAAPQARLPSLRNRKNVRQSKPLLFRNLNELHQHIHQKNNLKWSFIFWKNHFLWKGVIYTMKHA